MIKKMSESEEKLADIIWEKEPVSSKDIVILCEENMGWKKSTTYTILKRLEEKGIFKNEKSTVYSVMSKNEYLSQQSCKFIDNAFGGSLPDFISAFTKKRKLSKKDIMSIKDMIDNYEEE